jgi:hypothetical protein
LAKDQSSKWLSYNVVTKLHIQSLLVGVMGNVSCCSRSWIQDTHNHLRFEIMCVLVVGLDPKLSSMAEGLLRWLIRVFMRSKLIFMSFISNEMFLFLFIIKLIYLNLSSILKKITC